MSAIAKKLGLRETGESLTVVGLFAGIGGIEEGLRRAGHESLLLCELMEPCVRVLRKRYPDAVIERDVKELLAIPFPDVLAAGFPCQDLSQAGGTAGIQGTQSRLVSEVFRLAELANPRWLLIENVPFMLQLDRGEAMSFLTRSLGRLGYRWAYRRVDARAFGLPQRRKRIILLASKVADPRTVLFVDETEEPEPREWRGAFNGFYWTEGVRGLGWAADAVPTLKGGSTVGIPSPPAIWDTESDRIFTPDIRDAERLQGFRSKWTLPAVDDPRRRNGPRWKLVGNAVPVPLAEWIGRRLAAPSEVAVTEQRKLSAGDKWPGAAWGEKRSAWRVPLSEYPIHVRARPLREFLAHDGLPLSERATAGFLKRARSSSLRFVEGFLEAVEYHLELMRAGDYESELTTA